jgi:hypothetical protein
MGSNFTRADHNRDDRRLFRLSTSRPLDQLPNIRLIIQSIHAFDSPFGMAISFASGGQSMKCLNSRAINFRTD